MICQILSLIQQDKNGDFQEIPTLLQATICPEVYMIKALFTPNFHEQLLSMVTSVFDVSFSDAIHLSEIGFVQGWQSILNFFVMPELCNTYFGVVDEPAEGTYIIKKYSSQNSGVHNSMNSDTKYNILLPLSPGGEISFTR